MRHIQTLSLPWLGESGVVTLGLRGFEKCLGKIQQGSLSNHACVRRLPQVGEIFGLIFTADPEQLVRHATADIAEA